MVPLRIPPVIGWSLLLEHQAPNGCAGYLVGSLTMLVSAYFVLVSTGTDGSPLNLEK